MNGVVLIGRPGSGKSAIGRVAAEKLGMIYVSSGDIARKMALQCDATRDKLDRGEMAPEDAMRTRLYQVLYDINWGRLNFILDGFPRFQGQLDWLRQRFPATPIINILATEDTCIKRLMARGRSDDDIQVIRQRMDYYNTHTQPILDGGVSHHVVVNAVDTSIDRAIQEVCKVIIECEG